MSLTRFCTAALLVISFGHIALAQDERQRPTGQDYLTPEESLRRLIVPEEFEVKLFAAEPDVVNPIAMAFDERGRVYVLECYEYPKGAPKGQKPRDRVKILEDTDGDHRADRVSVFADGFDLATGLEVGYGGVFVGAAPYLYFLRDTDGDGRADTREVLLEGWGREDTHELLNTFTWGPDGWLYGCHGVFTRANVRGHKFTAAVWRYQPRKKQFEVFAEGTSNPWGLDFDEHGSCLLTCCVIPHLFHMVPGGMYIRQARQNSNPYAYGELKEISDHLHHSESGWAHAGCLVLEGEQFPAKYRGSVIMGSIHGSSLKRDTLERRGSTYVGHHAEDFLRSTDLNFRPINQRVGPDGSIYVIDWHDQQQCHQAPPESWDRRHGRIYKIVPKGTRAVGAFDLSKKTSGELVDLLQSSNTWWYRMALRLLAERQDRRVAPGLKEMILRGENPDHRLRASWALGVTGGFDEAFALEALGHKDPWIRAWTVRLLGERGTLGEPMAARLVELAASEPSADVRLELAASCQRWQGADMLPILGALALRSDDKDDPVIPLMIWLAAEPRVLAERDRVLEWLVENAAARPMVIRELVPRVMRRLASSGQAEHLGACAEFVGHVSDAEVRVAALSGVLTALEGRRMDAPEEWNKVLPGLLKDGNDQVRRSARRLAIHFNQPEGSRLALEAATDNGRSLPERIEAVRDLAVARLAGMVGPVGGILARESAEDLRREALRALAVLSDPRVPGIVLGVWKSYSPGLRVEAVNVLSSRREWAGALLDALAAGTVLRAEVSSTVAARIHKFGEAALSAKLDKAWGKLRGRTPAELEALTVRLRGFLSEGRGDFERGRKVFEARCQQCHKFFGGKNDVGPDLTGAARDVEYLLANILDPNRVVGQPYFANVVALKSGQVLTGLLAAEDSQSITLKRENSVLDVIPREQIEERKVLDTSLMPQGLGDNMTPVEFRDLVQYVMANPFLTRVAVAGPFEALDPLDAVFAPEGADQPQRTQRGAETGSSNGAGGNGAVKWTQPEIGPTGRINLTKLGVNRSTAGSAAYVSAEVESPSAIDTRLLFGAGGGVKIWHDGKLLHTARYGNRPAEPDQESVAIRLHAGINRLLFKVAASGGQSLFYARLLDPSRQVNNPPPSATRP